MSRFGEKFDNKWVSLRKALFDVQASVAETNGTETCKNCGLKAGDLALIFESLLNDIQTTTSVKLAKDVHANVECQKCHTKIGLLIGSSKCSGCGEDLNS